MIDDRQCWRKIKYGMGAARAPWIEKDGSYFIEKSQQASVLSYLLANWIYFFFLVNFGEFKNVVLWWEMQLVL